MIVNGKLLVWIIIQGDTGSDDKSIIDVVSTLEKADDIVSEKHTNSTPVWHEQWAVD